MIGALVAGMIASAEPPALPGERLQLAPDREGIVDVEWAGIGKPFEWDVGIFAGYELNPLMLYSTTDGSRAGALIAHRATANLVGNVALFDWVEIGADMPMLLFQARDLAGLAGLVDNTSSFSATATGDLRLIPKVRLLRESDQSVNLAIAPMVTLPTGVPDTSYFKEKQFAFEPEVLMGKTFGIVRVGGALGYRLRDEVTFLNVRAGQELFVRAGVAVDLHEVAKKPVEFDLTANAGTYALAPFQGTFESPAEVLLGTKIDLWGPWLLTGYTGFGVVGGYGVPDFRAGLGLSFSPRWQEEPPIPPVHEAEPPHEAPKPEDQDHDGVLDKDDACVSVVGLKEFDGCPDTDNDGIPDPKDQCPSEPETKNGIDDDDGCPEKPKLVEIKKEKIDILEKVYFDFNSDVIQERSFVLLLQVAKLLKEHDEIETVRIEGHTDSEGPDAYNMDLSQRRTESVKRFFVDHGVDEKRLEAKGFGESQPVVKNDSAANREKNRRVEFRIVKTAVPTMDFSK